MRRALPAAHQQARHSSSIDVGWNVATFACDLQARGDALRSFGKTLLDRKVRAQLWTAVQLGRCSRRQALRRRPKCVTLRGG